MRIILPLTILWVGAAFLDGGAAFFVGATAVLLPQALMLAAARHVPSQAAFSLWAGKFTVTILLFVVGGRVLQETGLWSAAFFVVGAVCALVANIAQLAPREAR